MKTTLKDIADHTGYSISTVSRVLNKSSRISEKTKTEVLNAARQLDYKGIIQSPASRQTTLNNVALVTDFHEGQFYASFFYGVLQSVKEEGPRISLLSVNNPKREVIPFIKQIISEGYFDGIILFIPELDHDDYKSIQKVLPADYPILSNALIDNPILTTITFDGYSGGYQAAAHFESLNLHKLGIIKGPKNKAESRFRYNGFRDYILNSANMDLLWEFEGDFQYHSGVNAFNNLLKSGIDLDGVFISNDLMATGFIDSAMDQGYSIPENLAVIGYDDLPMCVQTKPAISSVNTDFTRLGLYSIRELENKLHDHAGPQGKLSLIPVELKPRSSSVPAGADAVV